MVFWGAERDEQCYYPDRRDYLNAEAIEGASLVL
jgi:hypothetical protein